MHGDVKTFVFGDHSEKMCYVCSMDLKLNESSKNTTNCDNDVSVAVHCSTW